MSLDFQQVREQVILMGEGARSRVEHLQALQKKAHETLQEHASNNEFLRGKFKQRSRKMRIYAVRSPKMNISTRFSDSLPFPKR